MGTSLSHLETNDSNHILGLRDKVFLNGIGASVNIRGCDICIKGTKNWELTESSILERCNNDLRIRSNFSRNGKGLLSVRISDGKSAPSDIYFTNDPVSGAIKEMRLLDRNENRAKDICTILELGYVTPYPELENVRFGVPITLCPVCLQLNAYAFEDSMWKVWVLYQTVANDMNVTNLLSKIDDPHFSVFASVSRFRDFCRTK